MQSTVKLEQEVKFKGTFRYYTDCQITHRYICSHDLVIDFGNGWIPVDFHRLREHNPHLYDEIRRKAQEELDRIEQQRVVHPHHW